MIALTAGMFSLATASPLSAQARGMAPHMMLNGSVANDGSDYTQVGTPAFHPHAPPSHEVFTRANAGRVAHQAMVRAHRR